MAPRDVHLTKPRSEDFWLRRMESAANHDLWRLLDCDAAIPEAALPPVGAPHAAIDLADPGWPPELCGLANGPVALWLEGDRALLARRRIAIVGARRCTATGRAAARALARRVVEAGGVVLSGMAMGIDAEAHQEACRIAPASTVAVLGMGLSCPLPAWQQRLRHRILSRGGLLLSEFLPHRRPTVWSFPLRNRIIAGLAHAVVVVEAADPSGTRITADAARRYGRPLFACPGPPGAPPDDPASAGCRLLLAEGAIPLDPLAGTDALLEAAGLQGGDAKTHPAP